jgi:hypothetical protein
MLARTALLAATSLDLDAAAYIAAVEAADGATLEFAVRDAINDFVVGCKADGIWTSIKLSCILAGARTLAGALVSLKGTAPTNNGPFVSTDYNRKTGLSASSSAKYIDTNTTDNTAFAPQNDFHLSTWLSSIGTNGGSTTPCFFSGSYDGNSVTSSLGRYTAKLYARCRLSSADTFYNDATGLFGSTRDSSTQVTVFTGGASYLLTASSQGPANFKFFVFRRSTLSGESSFYSNARIAFYSFGNSINLSLLSSRVSTLLAAYSAAIP